MADVGRGNRTVVLYPRFDPGNPADRLGLVREVVALANSGGGEILFGVESHSGDRPGLDRASRAFFDAEALTDLIDGCIAPGHVAISTGSAQADRPGRHVISVVVDPQEKPPLVFSKEGRYPAEAGEVTIFQRNTVVTRHGARTGLATGADHRRWIDAAVRAERQRMLQVLTLASSLPPGASISIVHEAGEVSTEPRALLDRAVRSWRADPSKLLGRQDLLALFLARKALTLDDPTGDLVLHSALRRRATLWFWVDRVFPEPGRMERVLLEAVAGSDRDRSDAASSIVDLAALLLDPARHTKVVAALGSSRYRHFRDAAESGGDRQTVLERLVRLRDRQVNGGPLRRAREYEIEECADELGRALLGPVSANTAANRLLGPVGFELMLRHHRELGTALEIAAAGGEQASIFVDRD
jgi:hypothetical protein